MGFLCGCGLAAVLVGSQRSGRAEPVVVNMWAAPVVPTFDVFHDCGARGQMVSETLLVIHLGLHMGEEALGYGVVPAGADLAHGLSDLVGRAPVLKLARRVLGAAIRVEYDGASSRVQI